MNIFQTLIINVIYELKYHIQWNMYLAYCNMFQVMVISMYRHWDPDLKKLCWVKD